MRNWKRIMAALGTAALVLSSLGGVTQEVSATEPVTEWESAGSDGETLPDDETDTEQNTDEGDIALQDLDAEVNAVALDLTDDDETALGAEDHAQAVADDAQASSDNAQPSSADGATSHDGTPSDEASAAGETTSTDAATGENASSDAAGGTASSDAAADQTGTSAIDDATPGDDSAIEISENGTTGGEDADGDATSADATDADAGATESGADDAVAADTSDIASIATTEDSVADAEDGEDDVETLELVEQEVAATIYTDADMKEQAGDNVSITVSGDLPDGAEVVAYPAEDVEIEGQRVLAAYDITILVDGEKWQPESAVSVDINTAALADAGSVNVYHIKDEAAEPEIVGEAVAINEETVSFEAESFSTYAISTDTYNVKVVYYDANQTTVVEAVDDQLQFGIIAENLPDDVENGYTYQGAFLTTREDYTGTEIANVTVINDVIYYSVDADAKAVSALQDGQIIALHYVPTNSVVNIHLTEEGVADVEGNEVKGLPATYKANESLEFQVSARRGYTATVVVDGQTMQVASGKTKTIQTTTGSGDLNVTVMYSRVESVTFDPNVFQDSTYKYLYDDGTSRFNAANNRDQTAAVDEETGAGFTYTFTTKNSNVTWQIDSMKINGVYLEIPAKSQGSSATTTIVPSQNGEPAMTATLTVTNVRSSSGYTAYTYQLTMKGAYEDVQIDEANLNNVTWAEVIPSATEGVTFKNDKNKDVGLNQPSQTVKEEPSYTFGLKDGYEDLRFELYAYNSSGSEITLSSGIENNVITLPTNVGGKTTVQYQYKSGGGYRPQTYTYTDATITKNADGSYSISFASYNKNTGITLQLLKVSADKKQYTVTYNVGAGTGNVTDPATYDVVDNSEVVISADQPTPPEGQYFYGWKIRGNDSDTVYLTGASIDIASSEIQAILASQEDTKTLTLDANYITTLDNGKPIDVPVEIYLDGEKVDSQGYVVRGVVGENLALTNVEQSVQYNGVTYTLVKQESSIQAIQLGNAFRLYYVSPKTITIKKVDRNSGTALAGAQFSLRSNTGNTYYADNGATSDAAVALTTADGSGEVLVSGLPLGTYVLKEIKAPDGYNRLTNSIEITVGGDGVSTSGADSYVSASGFVITVKNEAGTALPETGGTGAVPLAASGMALLGIAIIGYSKRRWL